MRSNVLFRLPHVGKTLLLVILILLWSKSGILYAASDSLPYKVYWLIKDRNFTPQKNQLVAIYEHDTKYVHDTKFIKIVGGVFGDRIKIINEQMWINDHLVGKIRTHTNGDQPLTPINSQTIPAGWIFVYATHTDSFDSRYMEFGLVNVNKIIGKVKPLW